MSDSLLLIDFDKGNFSIERSPELYLESYSPGVFSMHSHDGFTQLTFYYIDGRTESYQVNNLINTAELEQEIRQEVRRFLDKSWWILHLPEETIFINTTNVIKVEMKPPLPELRGEDVFLDAQRVTALTRSGR
jgi:hypothetical protein